MDFNTTKIISKPDLSVIIPIWNEQDNLKPLVERIDAALEAAKITYELVFVDDLSTDDSVKNLAILSHQYPIRGFRKIKSKYRGKGSSIVAGVKNANAEIVVMIDADLQYPPEAIPQMYQEVKSNATDIVIANRVKHNEGKLRKTASNFYRKFFGKWLHNFDFDIQSGLKCFRKEILERFAVNNTTWMFDLEFLVKARDAGYRISEIPVNFSARISGKPKIKLLNDSMAMAWQAIVLAFATHNAIPFHLNRSDVSGNGFHYRGLSFTHHTTLPDHESAFHRLTMRQLSIGGAMIGSLILLLITNWHATLTIFIGILTLLYFGDLLFNLFLIYRSFSKPTELDISEAEVNKFDDNLWPKYTILCPLYQEDAVLSQFVTAMSKLDYPKDKLQVMLLMEADDKETVVHAKAMNLPSYFEIVVVPDSNPKTKPKACNYGLLHATGEYCTIYDAEDVPDPLQLKKAVIAFGQVDARTICIQAKLNFYNPHQNVLTKIFTAEYSLWFDLVLTGLHSINAPIPLGGTSNHFRTKHLVNLKGWDAFNVTEDCDLGMRLVKRGFKTAVINSTTYEEANSNLINWVMQRTRWIKGYIQTYFVHMRHPKQFMGNWREPHFLTFQLVVGGKVLSMFINPLMWIITISYFALRPVVGTFIESFYPAPVLYMAVFSLIFGNFLYMYYYMIGCAKREYDDIMKYVFLVPFYWLAMSISAWRAVFNIIKSPHYWSKTKHGLHLNNKKSMAQANLVVGYDLKKNSEIIHPPKPVIAIVAAA
jgi:glycosyltransferase XagB